MNNLTNDILGEKYLADVALAVSGYNYYGFSGRKGNWVILREKTDGLEYRYTVGGTGYAVAWAARLSKTYVRLDEL